MDPVLMFKEENDWHVETLTSAQAGFQHANAVIAPPASDATPGIANNTHAAFAAITLADKPLPTDGTIIYYCWTHSIGFNTTHMRATCMAPKLGHCMMATLCHMQGGGNTVMQHAHHTPHNPASAPPTKTLWGWGKSAGTIQVARPHHPINNHTSHSCKQTLDLHTAGPPATNATNATMAIANTGAPHTSSLWTCQYTTNN